MRKGQKFEEKTLKQKLTNSLASLAVIFGILSPIDLKITLLEWIGILLFTVLIVSLFHVLEVLKIKTKEVIQFFLKLEKDIDFIKKKFAEK